MEKTSDLKLHQFIELNYSALKYYKFLFLIKFDKNNYRGTPFSQQYFTVALLYSVRTLKNEQKYNFTFHKQIQH